MGEEGIMIYICSFWLVPKYFSIKVNQCCGAGAESRGAEIKLPTVAVDEITNCGSGSVLYGITDKSWSLKKFFVNFYNFSPISHVKKGNFQGIMKLS